MMRMPPLRRMEMAECGKRASSSRRGAGKARARMRGRFCALLVISFVAFLTAAPAGAQNSALQFANPGQKPTGQLLLQADQLTYDNDRQTVAAEGNVQIFYSGTTVLAKKVIYNRQTRRLIAEGGVKITDPSGNITNAQSADLTDDLRDGFVRSINQERKSDRTRLTAASGEREGSDVTVFTKGTYTACDLCKDNQDGVPEKPPLWQVRASRIIHKQQEQTIYYEDASLEFFGVPIAYIPYLWGPDGTVKRASGFLLPIFANNSRIGPGGGASYYLALSPFTDITLSPVYYSDQGLHLSGEWRQALPNGSFVVKLGGISQNNPNNVGTGFAGNDPGARRERGGVISTGTVLLSDHWRLGWDVGAASDTRYFRDYGFEATSKTERVSTVFLQGIGERSFFDLRTYQIRTYIENAPFNDAQSYQPSVGPLIDYNTALADPYLGGEFRFNANTTTVSRQGSLAFRFLDPLTSTTSRFLNQGFAGDYTRLSVDAQWRKSFTDPIGQRWTPFFQLRGDVYSSHASNIQVATVDVGGATNGATSFLSADTVAPGLFARNGEIGFRGLPTIGFEYRYPFIAAAADASHLIEPIAQVIVRPNEQNIGRLPNEDSQSLVFDDTNLFAINKFSGYDRLEGGSRSNIGVQYTYRSYSGFLTSVLFGQSYQLSGLNSFSRGDLDLAGTGLNSGLESSRSDYVAAIRIQPASFGDISARFRLDERDFSLRRVDLVGSLFAGPLFFTSSYTYIAAQPEIGFLNDREAVTAAAALKLNDNWTLSANGNYSLRNSSNRSGWVTNGLGLRFIDDCGCFIFSVDYTQIFAGFGDIEPQRRVIARVTLRTLGDVTIRAGLGAP